MNSWIKYWPLSYTSSTRLNWPVQAKNKWISKFSNKDKIFNILLYIRKLIISWFFIMIYLLIAWYLDLFHFVSYFWLYIYLYIIFLIFYEIWYIYNDIFSVKKEKNPTNYVEDAQNLKFWKINIFYRIFLWCICLYSIYFFNINCFFDFLVLLSIMLTTYFMHNIFRNYNINTITRTILRFCKIMIFIVVIKNIWINDADLIRRILESYIIFNTLDLFSQFIFIYNERSWWNNSEDIYRYAHINTLFISIILWIILKNQLFFISSLGIYRGVLNCIIILIKKNWLKSNR